MHLKLVNVTIYFNYMIGDRYKCKLMVLGSQNVAQISLRHSTNDRRFQFYSKFIW
jgi:hypothetical protein